MTATTTRAVDRALVLLAEVAERAGGETLSALARATDLSPSTALRLLGTLATHGLVERVEGRFRAGPRLKQIAAGALHDDPLYELAGPHLEALAQETGETANLAVAIDAARALYLRQVASPRLVRTATWTGRTIPRRGTALGAALAGRVGRDGFAAARRTIEPDVTAVAAPVLGPGAEIVGAISIIAPTYRTSDDDVAAYGAALCRHAAEMSAELQMTRQPSPPPAVTIGAR